MDQTCRQCRHWCENISRAEGECRRYPPTLLYSSESLLSFWPVTAAGDWCGEFLARVIQLPVIDREAGTGGSGRSGRG